MPVYNPLSWQNENALSSYPLEKDIEFRDFIVDAKFIQFDAFTPILNSIYIETDRIEFDITFDYGKNTSLAFYKSWFLQGEAYRSMRIHEPSTQRHLGVIVFGGGASLLWESFVGRRVAINTPFLSSTVRSIPLNDGVYSLEGAFGNVTLSKTNDDNSVFYNISDSLDSITFNAVAGNTIDPNKPKEGLRKINLVSPIDNNINLASNEVIKISELNAASLNISLVSGSKATAFAIPTLIA